MAISESTARARAAAVRKTFPKGPITISQAKAMVIAMADSQVGYASGSPNYSLYGKGSTWRTKGNWTWQGYWCARGISWVFDQCFGADAASAGIGKQGYQPMPTGWAATWLWRSWLRDTGKHVGVESCQPGDISLQSWGRTGKPTDHVELVTGSWNGSSYPLIGFNTSSASVTTGATVARVRRTKYALVGVYRPNWAALVAKYNASVVGEEVEDITRVHTMLIDLGYSANTAGVKEYQRDRGLVADGIPGPRTIKTLEEDMAKIDDVIDLINKLRAERTNAHVKESEKQDRILANQNRILKAIADARNGINVVGRVAREAREAAKEVPARIVGFRVPFKEGTSLHRLFGKDFRLGALLGYAAGSMVDRDTHTDEIVERLEDQMGNVEPVVGPGEVHNETK